jgi:hypothetical protein
MVYYPTRKCLNRRFSREGKINAFYSPEQLQAILQNSRFNDFARRLEGPPHALVHNEIGGDLSTMYSPNDPIFYLHHCFIDKVWADWQKRNPANARAYGGRNHDNTPAQLTDILPGYKYTVGHVLDTRNLCYEYDSSDQIGGARLARRSEHSTNVTDDSDKLESNTLEQIDAPIPLSASNLTLSADDRTDLTGLRIPNRIPDEWIRMNNQNVEEVRAFENELNAVNIKLNALDGYISPAALINKDKFLRSVIRRSRESRGRKSQLTATFGARRYVFNLENITNSSNAVDDEVQVADVSTFVESVRSRVFETIGANSIKRQRAQRQAPNIIRNASRNT